jgi:hypothetical protein
MEVLAGQCRVDVDPGELDRRSPTGSWIRVHMMLRFVGHDIDDNKGAHPRTSIAEKMSFIMKRSQASHIGRKVTDRIPSNKNKKSRAQSYF